jgi:hypothetical protein
MTRLAADGLRLCLVHTAKIGEDAVEAGRLHGELALSLTGTGAGGPRVSGGTVDKSTNLNGAAASARTQIRAVLVSWALFIAEERGWSLPEDRITAIAEYVARDPRWLASRDVDLALSASEELAELVRAARPIAYPSGSRVIHLGHCPESAEDGPCRGKLRALLRQAESAMPSMVVCDSDENHSWSGDGWRTLGNRMASRKVAA